ncbi:MAG: cupin domain-containing protein [Rhodobacteraceae bacterium]|nr:cupin domain-containing protein [Paracoccaceae bacterium]
MTAETRPDCITHWTEIEGPDTPHYEQDDELMGLDADMGRHFGLTRLGLHHVRLPPGRRTSFPHAESAEEEFIFVLSGTPDVWLDGTLHRLGPGDAVGFPAGTGLCHSFLNNTEAEVCLLVAGDTQRAENRIVYPLNPDRRPLRSDWWEDAPLRVLGDHDGLTAARRAARARKG